MDEESIDGRHSTVLKIGDWEPVRSGWFLVVPVEAHACPAPRRSSTDKHLLKVTERSLAKSLEITAGMMRIWEYCNVAFELHGHIDDGWPGGLSSLTSFLAVRTLPSVSN